MEINEPLARKVLEVVDAGLAHGVGTPEPGKMCVEAAVCFAMGLPHGDDPVCVSRALRQLKIRLNDSKWPSGAARAKGLRRLAVAQLGSRDVLDDKEFVKRCATLAIRTCVPNALRVAASLQKKGSAVQERLLIAADLCGRDPTRENAIKGRDAAYAASAASAADAARAARAAASAASAADAALAAYAAAASAASAADAARAARAADAAAHASARDKQLVEFAEGVVQILIDMKAPGCQWLWLTESK